MRRTAVGLAVLGLVLAGCQDETQQSEVEAQAQAEAAGGSAELYFAYPGDGQNSVPTSAPVFMRFGGVIDTALEGMEQDELTEFLRLEEVNGDGDSIAINNVQLLDDGRGIQAEPAESLTPGRDYQLTVSGLSIDDELVNETLTFSTAASDRGPLVERVDMTASADGFEVARITPYADGDTTSVGEGTDEFPVSDLSTFRIQFTEPLDENTLNYGEGESVQLLDGDGNIVEAEMLARDHHLTVDPDDTLNPGETYELALSADITSRLDGSSLNVPDSNWSFTPMDSASPSGEREVQAQKAVTNAGKLALTGKDANSVLLSATTLGQNNKTIQEGTVFAELGFVPRFDQADKSVPLRIERGALMKGSNVEVLVGGEVPAGYGSGEIDVRFVSDANGYLMPNPYTDSPDAPRIVRLFLDLAMNTGDERGNGALSQELLHVELIGTAMVEDGVLNLEAVSVIEPDVLGVDKASGLISFKLQTFDDTSTAPTKEDVADNTAPTLKSWAPGEDHQDKLQPQDSVSLFFNEPLLPSTVNKETVWLEQGGTRLDADQYQVRQNGANVIVEPNSTLAYGQEYEVGLDVDALTDLAGNELGGLGQNLSFSLPETNQEVPTDVGPVVLTARPGYPCAKDDLNPNGFDQSEGNGRCLGGMTETAGDQTSDWIERPGNDDRLPLEEHSSESPIIVRFSQNMKKSLMTKTTVDESGTVNEGTVTVERFNDGSGSWDVVEAYALEKSSRELRLVPDEGWEQDTVYRYTLSHELESASDVPLYTKLLAQFDGDGNGTDGRDEADFIAGGHDMVNRFIAGAPTTDVLTPLSNLPTNDVNGDFEIRSPEQLVELGDDGTTTAVKNSGKVIYQDGSLNDGLVEDANIGCQAQGDSSGNNWEDCPREKFIYKTAKLDVDLIDEVKEDGKVTVKLHPSVLFTSSLTVHVFIPDLPLFTLGTESAHQSIPTGPQVMRMRYEKDENGDRTNFITGHITRNAEGDLIFETELDVYLDAPYMDPNIPLTELDHGVRSFPINDLKLRGDIRFYDDGRMQIKQRNVEPIVLKGVTVDGNTLGGFGDFIGLPPTTVMNLVIPEGELYLNYITPYTQKEE